MTARETAALKRRRQLWTKADYRAEIEMLKRKIAVLERDRMFARSLLLPNQIAVYKAAMRWYEIWSGEITTRSAYAEVNKLARACARARKGTK